MKSLLILLLAVSANALDLTSSGGAGCTTNCTMTSLTTNGTAPSLTATGAVFQSSISVDGASTFKDSVTVLGSNVGITGAGTLTVISTITTRGQFDANSVTGPQGIFHGGNNGTAADVRGDLQVGGTDNNSARLRYGWAGQSETYLDNTYDVDAANDAGVSIRVRTAGTAVTALRAASDGGVGFYSRSIVQLMAIAPDAAGYVFYCNNCSPAKMVVSTGTSAGNFADIMGGSFQ